MAEPTSALSYYDLILRVAREAGIAYYGDSGNERAMIPVDEHDLDLCKRIVNDGIRMFIADAPPKGWRWMRRIMSVTLTATRITGIVDGATAATFYDAALFETYTTDNGALVGMYVYVLTGTGAGCWAKILNYDATSVPGTIGIVGSWRDEYGNPTDTIPVIGDTYAITSVETVGGDISRYPLAENFGGEVNGQIEYAADTNHGTVIEWRDEAFIRSSRAVSVTTGYPHYAAIRPLEFRAGGAGPKRRWELILDSDPVAADTLEFPYTLFFDELRLEGGLATAGTGIESLYDSALVGLYPDNYFSGWKIKIISGTGKNSYALVDTYTNAPVAEYAIFDIVDNDWLSIGDVSGGTHPASGCVYYVEPPGNLHPAGLRFDEVIKAACLAQAEMEIEDIAAGFVTKYAQKDLVKAYQADARSAPRKLGSMNLGYRPPTRIRTWLNVTHRHDEWERTP